MTGDYWVFGYGSLMWDPGFPHAERRPALLRGYHRQFCLWSHRYRGTPERPGLVLGLDRGGSCRGVAFRVPAPDEAAVREYLWERERPNQGYLAKRLPVLTPEGPVVAQTFVVDRSHQHYAGALDPETVAGLIATAQGERGGNRAYLENTVAHLREMGIVDRGLGDLASRVAVLGDRPGFVRPPHPPVDGPGF
jgi:cation transport protein ChaC